MVLRRFIPDAISTRIALVLALGLTLSHVASLVIYYGDPVTALTLLGRAHIAERIVTITRLVENGSPEARNAVLAATSNTINKVHISNNLPSEAESTGWKARLLKKVVIDHLGRTSDEGVHVGYDLSRAAVADDGASTLLVSIRIADAQWLTFKVPETEVETQFSVRFLLSLAIMALTVGVFAIWIVTRVTAPLSAFADAAARIGTDVQTPELPVDGPREVRQAATAFNEMQARLRRFVEDRVQMVASISHDLRTPITRLRLRAEFVEDAEQQAKMLADLDEMEEMIRSTLAFAREDYAAAPSEVVDLAALLHSLCDDLSDAGGAVSLEAEGRAPYRCHAIALRRALGNLITNALKYGEQASVQLMAQPDAYVIVIGDAGPGIPGDQIEKVFRPFQRLEGSRNRETGGTGLGLTIARSVIRGQGGELTLANRPEGGLRATVVLPRDASPAAEVVGPGRNLQQLAPQKD